MPQLGLSASLFLCRSPSRRLLHKALMAEHLLQAHQSLCVHKGLRMSAAWMHRSRAPALGGGPSYSFGWGLVPFGGYGGGYGGPVGGYGGGGGGISSLLLYGFIAAVAFSALSGFFKNNDGDVYGALPLASSAPELCCMRPSACSIFVASCHSASGASKDHVTPESASASLHLLKRTTHNF